MMPIGAFFWRAGWYLPSMRPAAPVKMTSGMNGKPLDVNDRSGYLRNQATAQARLTPAQGARKSLIPLRFRQEAVSQNPAARRAGGFLAWVRGQNASVLEEIAAPIVREKRPDPQQ